MNLLGNRDTILMLGLYPSNANMELGAGLLSLSMYVSQSYTRVVSVDLLLLLISGANSDDVCGSWCSKHSIFGCYGADPYASTHFSSEHQPKVSGIYLSSFETVTTCLLIIYIIFQNSKFLQFVSKMSRGELTIEDNQVRAGGDWANEYQQQYNTGSWADQYAREEASFPFLFPTSRVG